MWNLKGALSGDTPASQYGVLAGLRVTLHSGLIAPMNKPTSMPAPPQHCTLFHRHEGRSQTGSPLHCATQDFEGLGGHRGKKSGIVGQGGL
jgi:hypothetical protein